MHIRKKPPIIQTIVLPPPPPPLINNNYNLHPPANGGDNSSVLANSGQNGQINNPTTTNDPNLTPQAKEAQYVLMKMGINNNRPIKVTKSEGTAFIQEVNNMGGGGDAGLSLYRVTDTGKLQRVTVSYGNPNTTSTVDGYKHTNY